MIDNINYEKLIPSKAVRTMMNMKNIDDRSKASLIMNGYHPWKERIEMLKQLEESIEDTELKRDIEEYIEAYNGSANKSKCSEGNCSLLYSFVDIFNPFERGDIVCRADDPDYIGIVITSQRKWLSNRKNYRDYNDDLIRVDFITEAARIRNIEICPINLEFVQPDCTLPQYDFLKSLHNLIKGNGNVGMVMECYNELNR